MLTAYSVEPSLPFVLLDRNAVANAVAPDDAAAPTAAATVIARLDLLHGLVEQTRVEVLALRELNHQLLDLVAPAAGAVPGARAAGAGDRSRRRRGSAGAARAAARSVRDARRRARD